MPLPTTITPGTPGHIGDHEEIHGFLDDVVAGFNITQYKQGSYATRPAAGNAGRFFYATDAAILFFDTGSAWQAVGTRIQEEQSAASSNLTLTGVVTTIPGVNIGITTIVPNAIWKAVAFFDFQVDTTAGTNFYMVGEIVLDGAPQSGQAILQDNGVDTRATVGTVAHAGSLAAGAHTWTIRANKTSGTGAHQALSPHTKLVVTVTEGAAT